MSNTDLEKAFDQALLDIYNRSIDQCRYRSPVFFRMLSDHGGKETAKRLINASKPSQGYTELWLRGCLHLTVEAFVVENEKWHQLFAKNEIEKATKRLVDHEYKFGIHWK